MRKINAKEIMINIENGNITVKTVEELPDWNNAEQDIIYIVPQEDFTEKVFVCVYKCMGAYSTCNCVSHEPLEFVEVI